MTVRRASVRILLIPLWMLLAGLGGATLLRLAPGATVDERELDGRYTVEQIAAIRQSQAQPEGLIVFYGRFLSGLLAGDLGESRTLHRPVTELLAERGAATAGLVAAGIAMAWAAAATLAAAWLLTGRALFDRAGMAAGTVLLSMPAAVIAIAFLHWQAPASVALALVLFPRIYAYVHHHLAHSLQKPHILLAVAKGLTRPAIAVRHLAPHTLPALLSLAGLSVSLGLGAAVPLEVLCDRPGLGQLAWQSALSRDLPVLVSLTLAIALITLTANAAGDILSDAASARLSGRPTGGSA